ncbi:MAG: thioredoxin family protein [Bacillota bacterium]|nr:thioredoxin family protein [Bacillota bacterium]
MKEIQNYPEFESLPADRETFILYAQSEDCGVCKAFLPAVENLAGQCNIPLYGVQIDRLPVMRGQLSIFTVPLISVYFKGREYHRQARFLQLEEVKRRLEEKHRL